MWEKKRLLSEAKGRVQPFPHIGPTDQRTRRGFSPGRMGARQALARAVQKLEQAKQTNVAKDKRTFRQAQRERTYVRDQVISWRVFLEEKRALFRRGHSIVRY
jgi:hypothetical protein